MKTCAVVLAAGRSERFGQDKLWLDLQGSPLWLRSFETLSMCPEVDAVGIVCQRGRIQEFRERAPAAAFVVEGGETRQASSQSGVASVPGSFDAVLVHDAARPFVTPRLVTRVVRAVADHGAAFPALPVTDTVKQGEGCEWETLDRARLVAVQTPQGSRREALLEAHVHASDEFTDEAALLASAGVPCQAVPGEHTNVKVTSPEDLSKVLGALETRTGFGYDVHAFSQDPSRRLWIGGVEFEDRPGLQGHSDADALLHAVVDALLGAAGLGDIGLHHPDTEEEWRGAPSRLFVTNAVRLVRAEGWRIVNVDATVVGERPRISGKREEVCRSIADLLGVDRCRVNVKATTHERLGALGRGEGLAALACATLQRP